MAKRYYYQSNSPLEQQQNEEKQKNRDSFPLSSPGFVRGTSTAGHTTLNHHSRKNVSKRTNKGCYKIMRQTHVKINNTGELRLQRN